MTNFNHPQYRRDKPALDTSNIYRIAEEAVRVRLGPEYVADYGIEGCVRHVHARADELLVIELNSGGNGLAVEAALLHLGYEVRQGTPLDYGVSLVVAPGRVSPRNWAVG